MYICQLYWDGGMLGCWVVHDEIRNHCMNVQTVFSDPGISCPIFINIYMKTVKRKRMPHGWQSFINVRVQIAGPSHFSR